MGVETGPGRISADTTWNKAGDQTTITAFAALANFDIDGPKLKPAHTSFLDQVAKALVLFPEARITIVGSASKSGPHDHNFDLAQERGDGVKAYLVSKRVKEDQFAPSKPWAIGDAFSRFHLTEDELDRSVGITVNFEVKILDTQLFADNQWDAHIGWDDIIGMDDTNGHSIDQINLQLRAWGAPREWTLTDGTKIPVMPKKLSIKLSTRLPAGAKGAVTIPTPTMWQAPLRELPADLARDPLDPTFYRLSRPVTDAGRFVGHGRVAELATVGPTGSRSIAALRPALGWSSRGDAELPGNANTSDGNEFREIPDAKRLFQAGGVEILVVEVGAKYQDRPSQRTAKSMIRSPADVFYFDGDGRVDGCLMIGTDCYITPKDIHDHWAVKGFDTEVLIFAVSSLLDVITPKPTVSAILNGTYSVNNVTGPALEWAKLLQTKGGPLIAILGYRDDAPKGIVLIEVVKQLAAKINAGMKQEEWGRAWLEINATHPGKNTWNAVAMDLQGMWWIYERSWADKHVIDPSPFYKDTPQTEIAGPAAIP